MGLLDQVTGKQLHVQVTEGVEEAFVHIGGEQQMPEEQADVETQNVLRRRDIGERRTSGAELVADFLQDVRSVVREPQQHFDHGGEHSAFSLGIYTVQP